MINAVRSKALRMLVAGAALLVSVGCEGNKAGLQPGPSEGRLALPLMATGTSGMVYRLADATFKIAGTMSTTLSAPKDARPSALRAVLPVGGYTIELQSGWRLLRQTIAGEQDVLSDLVSPTVQAFSILNGKDTVVDFRFRAGDDIVLSGNGGLTVRVSVSDSTSGGGGTAKAWGTASLIESDNAGRAILPQLAIDIAGNAIAVWVQYDGMRHNIWANRYVAGSGWGTASLIESDDGEAFYPQVAIDNAGNAIVVWYQSDGTQDNIWANRYVAGSGWGTASLIESDNAGRASAAEVAIDIAGNAIAVWYQSDGTRYNVWANRYVAGSGWGTASLIESDSAGDASAPQVSIDSAGNAIVVWQQSDGTRNNIWANRYVAGSGWGTASLIESDNTGDASYPQVAVDIAGNAIAVWKQSDGTQDNIWANRYVAGSGWSAASLIESDNTGDASVPQVAVDSAGNATAVWEQHDGMRHNVRANRYVAGSGWGTPSPIHSRDAGSAREPQVAVDAAGNAIAVWSDSSKGIWANRYVAGSGWGIPSLIEFEVGDANSPQVAMNSAGNAIAVWRQSDFTRYNIWANSFR